MFLAKWFKPKKAENDLLPTNVGNVNMDMTDSGDAGYWFKCWWALGVAMEEARKNNQKITFRQLYFSAIDKFNRYEELKKLDNNEQHKRLNS